MDHDRPYVGIALLIFNKDGQVLLGKRPPGFMGPVYAGPGGHLELGETIEDCTRREALEEAGIELENIRVVGFTNMLQWKGRHYLDIGVAADMKEGQTPRNLEPDKCEGWGWYDPEDLPQPITPLEPVYLAGMKTGKMYHGTVR